MATEFDSGGGSKRRRTEEEGEQAQPDAEEAEEDRITTLPEALLLHILALLPLKSAIRTGALSTQWRALWSRRWPDPASLELRFAAHDSPQTLMESLERRGRRRLDRFSLSFQMSELKAEEFRRFLDYAAACAVADLEVHLSKSNQGSNRILKFRLPRRSPHLARVSLGGIGVGLPNSFRFQSHPYSVLEAIHLHRVTISDHDVFCLVAACPLLRTVDLRYCKGLCSGNFPAGANLKSVTVAECKRLADVLVNKATGLRSFRYSGGYLAADQIPTTIDDLYLCFGDLRAAIARGPPHMTQTGNSASCVEAVLMHSSTNALRRVSGKASAKSVDGNAAVCKLQNLREVQLLMFAMFNENLNDIMDFLMTCCSPRLERLFVQLPTRSGQYRPEEEPSDSEEDGTEENELEEELSEGHECDKLHAWEKHLCYGEESEEDQSEQDESDEEGSEENHSKLDESEENHSKVDESEDDGSEEDELEDELSEGQASEEDLSEGEESWEDQSKEEGSEESEEEGSEESVEEPLGDGCENLVFLKMMNFMGRCNEMRLVSFVLKKSASLNQLILFTPSDHPKGLHKGHLNTSDFLETKLLPLEKASPNAQIILSEPDATAVQPLHRETFVKV